ncbi:MAG TPA: hypothetical protein VLX92_14220 [Kofleriaceae bacterium]|nr:hypothetical protein [Kofleriaceae bacterium]
MANEPEPKTSLYEVLTAILLGFGALGGAWASYQSNQWGGTATADYGKAATTATRGSTSMNVAMTNAAQDSQLDLQAKQLIVNASLVKDPVEKERDLFIAKYLYTRKISPTGYAALGLPAMYRSKDDNVAEQLPEDALVKSLDAELDDKYIATMLKAGTEQFADADKVFKEGEDVSSTSTLFGLDGMFFTVSLFLGGMALVLKSHLRWGFMAGGYLSLLFGLVKLLTLPWYHA